MTMVATCEWNLHPDAVVLADARRWHRAIGSSLVVHVLAIMLLLVFDWEQVRQTQLPVLTVFVPTAAQPASPSLARTAPALQPREYPVESAPSATSQVRADAGTEVVRIAEQASSAAAVAQSEVSAIPLQAAAPTGVATKPTPPDPAALAGYGSVLAAAVERFKHYPRIALLRQWQGTVILQLSISSDGRIQDYRLARSSGHDALDQQALDMLRQALPLPLPPAHLVGMDLAVDIPVTFRIAN